MSRGKTRNCKAAIDGIPDSIKAFSTKAGVDPTSVTRFKTGEQTIMRTTFNKITSTLKSEYGVELLPENHWTDVPYTPKKKN